MKTQMVLIVNISEKVPTYHLIGIATDEQTNNRQLVSACGRTCPAIFHARLRKEHARKFAKACRRCFPQRVIEH